MSGVIQYVGITKNTFSGRMNGYKNPGPPQQTNRRINPRIKGAREVKILFVPESKIKEFAVSIRRGEMKKETALDLSTFERFMISLVQPPWNRE